MHRRLVILAAVASASAACGAFGEGSDAARPDGGGSTEEAGSGDGGVPESGIEGSVDPGPRCDPKAAFGLPVKLDPQINTDADETYAVLSEDEKTIYFARQGAHRDLWTASRPDRDAPFENQKPLGTAFNTPSLEDGCVFSKDGLLAIFASDREAGGSLGTDLYFTTRTSASANFGVAQRINVLSSTSTDNDAYLLPDKSKVYFGSSRTGAARVYASEITPTATSYTFSSPVTVAELVSNTSDGAPVVTADDLEIYWTSTRNGTNERIWHGSRPSRSDPFSGFAEVTALNDTVSKAVGSWVSADGCVFYFSSDRGGDRDIYMARRGN
jgi:Tol biopolymer transport system component